MKLDKLRVLQEHIDRTLSSDGVVAYLYYFFDGRWLDLASQTFVSENIRQALERARGDSVAYHAASNWSAWFYFSDAEFAVSLHFQSSPQIGTRRKYRQRIAEIYEGATNAYKVTHHSLTHLLAKDFFSQTLLREISEVREQDSSGAEVQGSNEPKALAVMALDIDHFKQVNDTWGHLYGDQVLKIFGMRLERVAEQIRERSKGRVTIYLGHPSGEEFLILISANVTREQFVEWANEFRLRIAEEVLPTDSEWEWLCARGDLSALVPPHLPERTVTTSIGVAVLSGPLDVTEEASTLLLDRADTALYRSKAGGRNQVTLFDEILSAGGLVLEQDVRTQVVAIDMGSSVGVAVGQEFKVFSPKFNGKKKFSINDGRTTKTLGIYPRVESARIVVFNTQREISFAFVASEDKEVVIEVGSHLEAIPAGSIGHLLPNFSKYFPSVQESSGQPIQGIQEFLEKLAGSNLGLFAIVIRFTREAEYTRRYGTAALNLVLAQLYRQAQVTFHAAEAVEVLDPGSICVAGGLGGFNADILDQFVESMALDLPELGVFAGVFSDEDPDMVASLDSSKAIEFARFAASNPGRLPDSKVRSFSHETAVSILKALRDAREHIVGYADFVRLRGLGVESGPILNMGGLLASTLGSVEAAAEHYLAAVKKDPDNIIYKSNYGTVAYPLGEIEPALQVLNTLTDNELNELERIHQYGYLSYAKIMARAKLLNSPLFEEDRFSVLAQKALLLSEFKDNSAHLRIITDAISHAVMDVP